MCHGGISLIVILCVFGSVGKYLSPHICNEVEICHIEGMWKLFNVALQRVDYPGFSPH